MHSRVLGTACTSLTVLLLYLTSMSVHAETWMDTFDDPDLPGWRRLGPLSEWTTVGGSLKGTIPDTPGMEQLQFTGLRGPYDRLEVSITHVRGFSIGLVLGKACPGISSRWNCYIFRGGSIMARGLGARGGNGPFRFCDLSPENPEEGWWDDIDDTEKLVVRFDGGVFQVSVNGKPRAEFEDTDFDSIDIISFVLDGWGGPHVSYVDSFHFSGVLSVEPGEKLATTWAGLKR